MYNTYLNFFKCPRHTRSLFLSKFHTYLVPNLTNVPGMSDPLYYQCSRHTWSLLLPMFPAYLVPPCIWRIWTDLAGILCLARRSIIYLAVVSSYSGFSARNPDMLKIRALLKRSFADQFRKISLNPFLIALGSQIFSFKDMKFLIIVKVLMVIQRPQKHFSRIYFDRNIFQLYIYYNQLNKIDHTNHFI